MHRYIHMFFSSLLLFKYIFKTMHLILKSIFPERFFSVNEFFLFHLNFSFEILSFSCFWKNTNQKLFLIFCKICGLSISHIYLANSLHLPKYYVDTLYFFHACFSADTHWSPCGFLRSGHCCLVSFLLS